MTPPVRSATARGKESRQRLMDAAWPLFYSEGVSQTSIEDIATAAGMGKSRFYHYFKSKEELVCEVVDFHIERILNHLKTQSIESIEGLQPWFDAYISLTESHRCMGCPVGVIAAEVSVASDPVRLRVIAAFERWVGTLTDALGRLQAKGELGPDFRPRDAAEIVATSVQGALLLTRVFRDSSYLRRTFEHVYRMLELDMPPAARQRGLVTNP